MDSSKQTLDHRIDSKTFIHTEIKHMRVKRRDHHDILIPKEFSYHADVNCYAPDVKQCGGAAGDSIKFKKLSQNMLTKVGSVNLTSKSQQTKA